MLDDNSAMIRRGNTYKDSEFVTLNKDSMTTKGNSETSWDENSELVRLDTLPTRDEKRGRGKTTFMSMRQRQE